MVYTLTLNPCIDYYMNIPELVMWDVNRSKDEQLTAGGKGINVSSALGEMGIDNTAMGIIGGSTSSLFLSLLEEKNIKSDFVTDKAFTTRINTKIASENGITECNGNGAYMNRDLFEKVKQKLSSVQDGDTVVISGNKPPCELDNTYGELITVLKNKKVFVIADTSGNELLNAAKAGADLLKPNISELTRLFDCSNEISSVCNAARKLISHGAGSVLLSMGDQGAMLFTDDRIYKADIPCIGSSSNTVGAGDCSVAGYVYALIKGEPHRERLASAVAAGTARTCSNGFFDGNIFYELRSAVNTTEFTKE